jgi:hypothetical protein
VSVLIIIMLHYLGNNDKKKQFYVFNTDTTFFPNIFNSFLVGSVDVKPSAIEG